MALVPHEVQAIVPVAAAKERQTVDAEVEPAFDRPNAVVVERSGGGARLGQVVGRFLVGPGHAALQEGHRRVEHARVAGRLHVAADRRRQPEEVVGTVCADAAALRRMPPVLHVALLELSARRAEQVFAKQFGGGVHERHRILELIAEAVSPR